MFGVASGVARTYVKHSRWPAEVANPSWKPPPKATGPSPPTRPELWAGLQPFLDKNLTRSSSFGGCAPAAVTLRCSLPRERGARASREERCMREDQSVSEMAEEVLAPQAEVLVDRASTRDCAGSRRQDRCWPAAQGVGKRRAWRVPAIFPSSPARCVSLPILRGGTRGNKKPTAPP